ncbi:flippase-like domain-containing protein [Actinomycetaceae bacterium TAE3-ERU4]|nr:flippase-like domain-containing protein [Actinomycetaceae bacterium TAE3-ERU4]
MTPQVTKERQKVELRISKKALFFNVSIVLLVLVSIVLYVIFSKHGEIFLHSFKTIKYSWILLALGLLGIYLGAEVVSLQVACRVGQQKLSFQELISISLIGQFYGIITPMATGAQPAQLYYFTRLGAQVGKSAFVLLSKFIAFQVVLTTIAATFLIVRWDFFFTQYGKLMWVALPAFGVHIAVVLALIVIALSTSVAEKIAFFFINFYCFVRRAKNRAKLQTAAQKQIENFSTSSRMLKQNWVGFAEMSAITVVQLIAFYLIPTAVLLAFHAHPGDIVTMTGAAAVVIMLQTAMPLPAGAGAAEGGFAGFFALFLGDSTTLVAALLVWRVITMLIPLLGAIPFLFYIEVQAARR